MNLVSWHSSIKITKRINEEPVDDKYKTWTDLVKPRNTNEFLGNSDSIKQIEKWFKDVDTNDTKSSCLFVHGESGTGKSTSVAMISERMGFHNVHTYADKPRTPVKLEGVIREAGIYGNKGVVILDDFEIFLSETTSLRVMSKFLRQLVKEDEINTRVLFVIISNSKHKLFAPIQDFSTIVSFDRLSVSEMQKIFNRMASRVKKHSYVPPMATFFASAACSGTITQGVQQLQFIYQGNKEPVFRRRPRKKLKYKHSITNKNNRDSISYLWSEIYTDKMFEHLIDSHFDKSKIVNRLMAFDKDRLDLIGKQVYDEYIWRITVSSVENVEKLAVISDSLSLSDTNRREVHEDGLYDGENRDKWSANDITYVSGIASCINHLQGYDRRHPTWSKRLGKIRITKFSGIGNPLDAHLMAIINNNN